MPRGMPDVKMETIKASVAVAKAADLGMVFFLIGRFGDEMRATARYDSPVRRLFPSQQAYA